MKLYREQTIKDLLCKSVTAGYSWNGWPLGRCLVFMSHGIAVGPYVMAGAQILTSEDWNSMMYYVRRATFRFFGWILMKFRFLTGRRSCQHFDCSLYSDVLLSNITFIGTHCKDVACYGCSVICASVERNHALCYNGWTDQDVVWSVNSWAQVWTY